MTTPPIDSIDWGTELPSNLVFIYFLPEGLTRFGERTEGWTAYEIRQVLAAANVISQAVDVRFFRTYSPANADLQLFTFEDRDDATTAFLFPPGTSLAGLGGFNRGSSIWEWTMPGSGSLERGGEGFETILHELSHGLGLAHPHDTGGISTVMPGVASDFDDYGQGVLNQAIFTVMTYNSGWPRSPAGSPPTGANYGFMGSLGALDIAALQAKYGAAEQNPGNTLYTLPAENGRGTFYASIWDTGGTDEIRAPLDARATIDLREATLNQSVGGGGYVSYAVGIRGGFTIASGTLIENARGSNKSDRITGNGADNRLLGLNGNDFISGLGGNDLIVTGNGTDRAFGSAGNDRLIGGREADVLSGGDDSDVLLGKGGNDTLLGGDGADTLVAGPGSVAVDASSGDDVLRAVRPTSKSLLDGGAGDDRLDLVLGPGNDRVSVSGAKTFVNGNDIGLRFEAFRMFAGDGRDRLTGGSQGDLFVSGDGNDVVRGGGGDDDLRGGAGNDRLFGEAGNDTLQGGAGNDVLTGGPGDDVFLFNDLSGLNRVDDFGPTDSLVFAAARLADFAAFQAAAETVGANTVLTLGTDRIVFVDITEAQFMSDQFSFV